MAPSAASPLSFCASNTSPWVPRNAIAACGSTRTATSEPGPGTDAQLALAQRYGRDPNTANSPNYTNGIQVTQIAVEAMRRVKAKSKKVSRATLYDELQAMNGYNAYYPLTTVGPVTYSKTDHQGVDELQLYRVENGVFHTVGAPFTSKYIK